MTDTQLRDLVHAIAETAPDPPSWPLTAPSRPASAGVHARAMVVVGLVFVLACVGLVAMFNSGSDQVGPRNSATRTFTVPSGSMSPTVQIGQTVQVDTSKSCCERGDIVVFRTAPNELWHRTGVRYLIKRVVAVPGDTITPCDAARVCIDGKAIPERYLPRGTATTFPDTFPSAIDANALPVPVCAPDSPSGACTVPQGTLFVLGDNRTNSLDSRALGPIRKPSVIGPVVKIR